MPETDRRVRRTRRALLTALVELVLDKGYDRITVQDILDRADIGRSTFYAHFRDKESLLLAAFDDLRLDLELDAPTGDIVRPVQALYEHANQRQVVYQALCGRRAGSLVHRHLHDLLVAQLTSRLPGGPIPPAVAAEYYASAALGLLTWWIDTNFTKDVTWVVDTFRALSSHGR